jgi:SsrA-binding protein
MVTMSTPAPIFEVEMARKPPPDGRKVVASNRRAHHIFTVIDTYECGIALTGSEVKSLRAGQVQLKDAFGEIQGDEIWLRNAHIAPYQFASGGGHEPERPRKLLLHRREIERLIGKVAKTGLTLVPMSIYFRSGLAKVELALAKGRTTYDKREAIKEREMKREMDKAQRHRA